MGKHYTEHLERALKETLKSYTAIQKMEELKASPNIHMDWSSFEINAVTVQ